jgi:hypothetical protein
MILRQQLLRVEHQLVANERMPLGRGGQSTFPKLAAGHSRNQRPTNNPAGKTSHIRR